MPRIIQIIGGEFRSRRLETPDDESTRPITARAKESVFNLLRGWFDDAAVLDLFAGVGTMGLEAMSRGAAKVVFVERDRTIVRCLQRNIESLGCQDRAVVFPGDALHPESLAAARAAADRFDVIFMDPPYATMEDDARRADVFAQAARCRALMGEKGFLVLRTPLDPATHPHAIQGFDGPEVHRYGGEMSVLLYAPRV